MARRISKTPPKTAPRRIVRTIRRSNYYLKMILLACFIFLLGIVTAYQFLRRVPVNNLSKDLSSDQLAMKQVLAVTPTPTEKTDIAPAVGSGEFKVKGQITPTAAKTSVKSMVYTVKSGDSLWSIAKDVAKDPYQWSSIYAQNRKTVGQNPNLIYPGMQLTITVSE